MCFEFYLGIGFEFEFGYWVLFKFELVAVIVGGEIGLPERERERREMVLGYIILLCRSIILMCL